MSNFSKKIYSRHFFLGFFSAVIILGAPLTGVLFLIKNGQSPSTENTENNEGFLVKTASAAEIYPEFVCGCCGASLDPNNICCGMAGEMIDFIDAQVSAGLSKDEVIVKAAKEFGMDSFARQELRGEMMQKLIAAAPADAPKLVFEKTGVDLGDVRQSKGIASAIFNFKNEGKSNLVINKLESSCGCTSASVIYKGIEGPVFTMPGHGGAENPTDWQVMIAPGETAELKVYYDPNVHKDLRGPVTRAVSVFSNDAVNFETEVKIELNQIP